MGKELDLTKEPSLVFRTLLRQAKEDPDFADTIYFYSLDVAQYNRENLIGERYDPKSKEWELAIKNFNARKGSYDLMKTNLFSIAGRISGIAGSKIQEIKSKEPSIKLKKAIDV